MNILPRPTNKNPEPEPGRRRPGSVGTTENRPQAFSYYSGRSSASAGSARERTERQPLVDSKGAVGRLRAMHARTAPRTLTFVVGGLVLLMGAWYALYLSGSPKIVVKTSGGTAFFLQGSDAYRRTVADTLSASMLNHSKLTVDTTKVSQQLIKAYPEIKSASVSVPLFGTSPVVTIEPYPPACIVVTPSSSAFLLDTNGRALVSTSQISDKGELSVPTVHDQNATPTIHLGGQALPASVVLFVRQVTAVLDAAKVQYGDLTLPSGTSELDVAIANQPYFVKLNLQADPRLQAGTFLALRQRLQNTHTTPSQYIDVRVPGRAYYK